jgi:hypothetical protein
MPITTQELVIELFPWLEPYFEEEDPVSVLNTPFQ